MALKAGRVGIDPMYVDISGKPIVEIPPTPVGSDSVEWITVAENTTTATWDQKPGDMTFFNIFWDAYVLYTVFVGNDNDVTAKKVTYQGNIGTDPSFSYSNGKVTATWGSNNYAKVLMKKPAATKSTRKTSKKS